MKNLNKITKYFITLFWLGFNCSILKSEVVITELFILQVDDTHIPQYIELYNNSDSPISIENWSLTTLDDSGLVILESLFDYSGFFIKPDPNLEIDPFDYLLVSSATTATCPSDCYFDREKQSDIIASYLIIPFDDPNWNYIDKGSIVLTNDNKVVVDRVDYDIAAGWPVGEESRGRSLRLHVAPNSNDNDDPNNWSLSPETEKSIWLHDVGEEIKSFGSPRKENAFRLKGDEDFIHTITGDVNTIYVANNYADSINFSWYGTFDNVSGQQYKLIIEKRNTKKPQKHGFEAISYPNMDKTLIFNNIIGTDISISPDSLFVDQLEVADYSWTLELTKGPGPDTIYSDRYNFTVDASDYGYYGCIDENSCKIGSLGYPTCPTTADDDTLFSNHPNNCIPGIDCYSAINFDADANIYSNTSCHYVSLSIPAFIVGDVGEIITVPVYLYNESFTNIDSIGYTLSFDNSSNIISYYGDESTFSATILSDLGDQNIVYDNTVKVNMKNISINGTGIITYLGFKLDGEQGSYTDLSFTAAKVKGGDPINDIEVPVSRGEVVILQTDYEISGQVFYYDSPDELSAPCEIPNVEISLDKNYDGISYSSNFSKTSNENGRFKFDLLTEGNYNLSFSKEKESTNDCNGNSISGTDVSRISRYMNGSESFNANQLIAADVSLDGTVSGYDASLIAQCAVDLIDNFNDIQTHWNFKPFDEETLPDVHAEILEYNGQYSIEYKPLVLDDTTRHISAYRLGDVNGNYCYDPLSRYNNGQVQFTNIVINYTPVITLPIIISDPTFIEGMDIEIRYDKDMFSPHSINFNTSNIKTERYNSISNLSSIDGSIKTVTWAIVEPQIVEGKIGEVSFNWNNNKKSGKIWLKDFQINDKPAVGGISLIGLSDNDAVEGVNIINSLIPVELSLHQNYPNPFNPQTTIKWSMPSSGIVSLEVYNLQGQLVELLINGELEAGIHEQIWDATAYPSGIYFYRLIANGTTLQRIMLLLK